MKNARALGLMLRLARLKEDQAAALARAAQGEARRLEDLRRQLEQFAGEYRMQAAQMGQQGTRAGWMLDAQAFGQRLDAGAEEQAVLVGNVMPRIEEAKQHLAQARLKTRVLEKLVEKQRREARRTADQAEARALDDAVAQRARTKVSGPGGMEDA